jgi:hypothetical protein
MSHARRPGEIPASIPFPNARTPLNAHFIRINGSKTRLASLIFKAKYGEPPRSGWFANMTLLYRSANLLRDIFLSLNSVSRLHKGCGGTVFS